MNWPKGKCPSSASELENILGKSAKEQRRHELSILFVYFVFETFRCHVSCCIQLKYLASPGLYNIQSSYEWAGSQSLETGLQM